VRILIAGCGYVGSALGHLLSAGDHTAFGLRRDTKALPPAIKPISADHFLLRNDDALK
jgi:nucleoside-diphosphate-sugar epimerase